MNLASRPATSNTATAEWREWNPGLENDELTLRAVFDTLPAGGPEEIDPVVRLLENPASPYRAPGGARLRQHNSLHILLGRGLLNQDEAFVIGYAMGTVREHISEQQVQSFRRAARLLYKPPYRMTDNGLIAFDLAFALANRSTYRNVDRFDFDRAMDLDLGDIRKEAGIDTKALKAVFREERLMLPGNKASQRLAVI